MPPNTSKAEIYLEKSLENDAGMEKLQPPQAEPRVFKIVWFNLISFGYWHLAALYGLYLCFSGAVKWQTILFGKFVFELTTKSVNVPINKN